MGMYIKEGISDEQLLLQVKKILNKYQYAYTSEEISYIMNAYESIRHNNWYNYLLREIYDELDIIKPEENLYERFIDLIDGIFGIDKNIVEIGGGIIPSLSKRIALRQKHGTVTVFDPRLAIVDSTVPNLKLVKEKFTPEKLPPNTDLIIGLHPYGGTETIVETACKNDKDFIIALGDLPYDANEYIDENEYDYLQRCLIGKALSLVRTHNLGELEETDLDQYGTIYPIIYNKRK